VIISSKPSDDLRCIMYFCSVNLKSKYEVSFGSIQSLYEMKVALDLETISVLKKLNIKTDNKTGDSDIQKTIFTYCRNLFDCGLLISKLARTIETESPYVTTNAVQAAAKLVKSEHYLDDKTKQILYPNNDLVKRIYKLSENINYFAFLVRKGVILNDDELGLQINPIILS
jgi:hypothetical protein